MTSEIKNESQQPAERYSTQYFRAGWPAWSQKHEAVAFSVVQREQFHCYELRSEIQITLDRT